MGNRCADHVTPLYPQRLALTSPTGGGRSVGIVRSRTKATEVFSFRSVSSWFYCKEIRHDARSRERQIIEGFVFVFVQCWWGKMKWCWRLEHQTRNEVQWRAVVNTLMNIWFPWNLGYFRRIFVSASWRWTASWSCYIPFVWNIVVTNGMCNAAPPLREPQIALYKFYSIVFVTHKLQWPVVTNVHVH